MSLHQHETASVMFVKYGMCDILPFIFFIFILPDFISVLSYRKRAVSMNCVGFHECNYILAFFKTDADFQWNALMSEKPNPEDDDPVDMAAIKDASERMGDYKLKSAHDYTVPDHLRMNTNKARSRLLVVKEKVSLLLCCC